MPEGSNLIALAEMVISAAPYRWHHSLAGILDLVIGERDLSNQLPSWFSTSWSWIQHDQLLHVPMTLTSLP